MLREESEEASAIHREPVERQREFWAGRFRDAGWQTERFIGGMVTSPFFYSHEVAQVRIGTWSQGRVVLAGEINRHPDDLPTALACFLRIPDLVARWSKDDRGGDWRLPEITPA